MALDALFPFPTPLHDLPADPGHGIESPAYPDLRAVGQLPAVPLGVVGHDVVPVHGLEEEPSAGPQHAPGLRQGHDVLCVVEEQAQAGEDVHDPVERRVRERKESEV